MDETTSRNPARGNSRARSLLADLVVSSAAGVTVAIASALIHTTWAAVAHARNIVIAEAPVIWIARYVTEILHHPFVVSLPEIASRSLDPRTVRGFVSFLAGVTTIDLAWIAFASLVMLPAWPVFDRIMRMIPGWRQAGVGMISVFVFTLPSTVGLCDHFFLSLKRGPTIAIAIAVSAALAAVVFGLLCWKRDVRTLVRRTMTAAAAAILLAWIAGGIILATPRPGPPTTPGAPNILLVSIDSLRAGGLHCYGNPRETSPTIDSLAAEGALFEHAISPTSWTLPSHMSLMTALPPSIHGVNDNDLRLKPGVSTIASVLRSRGYRTAGIVSANYLEREYGFSTGFDEYDDYSAVFASPRFARISEPADRVAALATRWLAHWNDTGRPRPFFLFLHFWDVHFDYVPPPPFDTMFDPGYHGPITGKVLTRAVHRGMPGKDLRHLVALYDGEIRHTDQNLRKIIAWLEKTGTLDKTIVVLVADHGDEFFEHGGVTHEKTLYDEVLHVPMIIRYPGKVPAGLRVTPQVRLMDVGPTILSLAGIDRRMGIFDTGGHPSWLATDLTPLLDPARARGMAPLPAFGRLKRHLVSLRTSRAKIIVNLPDDATELYDLMNDPREQLNEWSPTDPSASALFAELQQWRHQTRGRSRAEPVPLSREHRDALRALGYLH